MVWPLWGCYSSIPPWPPGRLLAKPSPPSQPPAYRASIKTEKGEREGHDAGSRKYPRPPWFWLPASYPSAPYPGLPQLRLWARLGLECHPGAKAAFPRLGLRGQQSRPSGQGWRAGRLPAPEVRGRGETAASFPRPPQLAEAAGSVGEVRGLGQGAGRSAQGRQERSPGEVTGAGGGPAEGHGMEDAGCVTVLP